MSLKCPQNEITRQDDKNLDEWLNSQEAARFLSVSNGQLRNLTSNGRIPFYKFGRSNRFKRSELEKVLEKEPRGVRDGD
jgi:excisionase family DNA binding protein